jgi:hypothetical protein
VIVKLQPKEDPSEGSFLILPPEVLGELGLRPDEWVQFDILDRSVETESGLMLPVERIVRISKIHQ